METKNNQNTGSANGGSFIAAICIVIYLGALVQGSVRTYLSIEQSSITAEQEFLQIADIALSASRQGFMDEKYIQTINSALISTKNIEALIITGTDGGHAFEKKTGSAIAWVHNSPRFVNKFYFSNQNFYRPLAIPDVRDANIKAVATAFDISEFLKILKDTLLMIMIGFSLSFFTMLIQYLIGSSEKSRRNVIYSPSPAPAHAPTPAPSASVSPANVSSQQQTPVSNRTESGPKGLYSSRSNIGWQEYTKDRLDSELHRCSSTEKDLVLLIMGFSNINNDMMYKQAAEEAVSFFTSRDLLFEYGSQGITVILPGIGLDVAIGKAENFYQRMMEKYANSFGSSLKIGLSSRSGRLLNADRLILEANEALKKAKNDSKTSIIAFRSDPDKYRDFIRTHS